MEKRNKIAIVGAGFAGLAVATLLAEKNIPVDLFDIKPIGEGTSGIAAGLISPFAGKRSKLNRDGFEAMQASKRLFELASLELGKSVIISEGIYRPAMDEEQRVDFQRCAAKYPSEVCWVDHDTTTNSSGLFVRSALTVDCKSYLIGLWQFCKKKGANFFQENFDWHEQSTAYEAIYICIGAHCHFPGVSIKAIKGQILTLRWPKDLKPLPFTINSYKYLSMDASGEYCHAGATFERDFLDENPDVEYAKKDILPYVSTMIPELVGQEVINCKAGIRASTPDKYPTIVKIDQNKWIFTGLGSKGLLYHAFYAEKLLLNS